MSEINYNIVLGNDNYPDKINFEGVIGQNKVIEKLSFFISSQKMGMPIPTILFTGSHGLGKTYIAEKVANNLGRRFVVVNADAMATANEFLYNVLMQSVAGDSPATVLIDESHKIPSEISTLLLSFLNPNKSNINKVTISNINVVLDMSKINFIFATTDAHEMLSPLKNRCEPLYFDTYNDKDIMSMIRYYTPGISISCNEEDLAKACRSRARDAFFMSNNIKRFTQISNKNTFDENDWISLKSILDIKPLGLTSLEVKLLKCVSNFQPISCANIAMSLMVKEENVRNEIEIRLRELSFINTCAKGRLITDLGKAYLENFKEII